MANQNAIILSALIGQLRSEIAPDMKADDYFEIFSNEQILKEYDLSYEEILKGTLGKGGDGGIDGLFIFANGALLDIEETLPKFKGSLKIDLALIQSKNETGFGESVIQKFISSAADIFSLEKTIDSLKTVYNEDLLNHIKLFRDVYMSNITKQPELNISYFYACKGEEIHPNVSRKIDDLKATIKSYFNSANFSFEFVTAEKLLKLSRKKPKESFTLKLKESPISTEDGGYICIAKLDDYFGFITDEDKLIQKYMFDANVRDYQGATVVNKDIFDTLKNENEFEFWWLNNGITILTNQASVSSKILTLSEPQIVNGCQTSFEIYSYFKEKSVETDSRSLTIRVIVTTDEKIKSKIIKSTNSQTAIPAAVLSATDQIHRRIEEYFKHNGLYYDRRKNYWKNEQKPIKDIISISLLSQTFKAMILQEPHISRAKPSSLVKNEEDYNKIFNQNYNIEGYLKLIKLQRRIEKHLILTNYLGKGEVLNIRYFVYMHFVLNNRRNKAGVIDKNVKEYFDEFISIDFNFIKDIEIEKSIKIVFDIYKNNGGTDGTAKAKYFTEAVIKSILNPEQSYKLI
ncbi:AIPR family protein [Priestia megaterium]|uniref:AIPR family protein n=1 Tax=Priestia megaterium TaxID=1404 RepID=UPI0021D66791|nr:AIPR family protein [Priestia megaterium]MCU7746568.1 AIPR family protein [Priestia megaterium]